MQISKSIPKRCKANLLANHFIYLFIYFVDTSSPYTLTKNINDGNLFSSTELSKKKKNCSNVEKIQSKLI